ncbi:hypothetical protein [Brevibacillus brevis]|nr:hypothetical protein [Brevibacillus brevis]RED21767.1 hypothetical protein DES34_11832 [Brevibacillus brevis]VEF92630.1 Uncharacterised protein [Brevibacillus brevis]
MRSMILLLTVLFGLSHGIVVPDHQEVLSSHHVVTTYTHGAGG